MLKIFLELLYKRKDMIFPAETGPIKHCINYLYDGVVNGAVTHEYQSDNCVYVAYLEASVIRADTTINNSFAGEEAIVGISTFLSLVDCQITFIEESSIINYVSLFTHASIDLINVTIEGGCELVRYYENKAISLVGVYFQSTRSDILPHDNYYAFNLSSSPAYIIDNLLQFKLIKGENNYTTCPQGKYYLDKECIDLVVEFQECSECSNGYVKGVRYDKRDESQACFEPIGVAREEYCYYSINREVHCKSRALL